MKRFGRQMVLTCDRVAPLCFALRSASAGRVLKVADESKETRSRQRFVRSIEKDLIFFSLFFSFPSSPGSVTAGDIRMICRGALDDKSISVDTIP